jgi:hypothetical protein
MDCEIGHSFKPSEDIRFVDTATGGDADGTGTGRDDGCGGIVDTNDNRARSLAVLQHGSSSASWIAVLAWGED